MKGISKAIVAAGAGASAFAGASFLCFYEIMNKNASIPTMAFNLSNKIAAKKAPASEEKKPVDIREEWFNQQEFEKFTITNEKGQNLRGRLLRPDTPSDIYAFCCHGYRSSGRGEYKLMTKFFHDMGWNVFLIDHTASGDSDGKYIGFGYYESRDALLWLDFLIKTFGADIKIFLEGISMGSATVMMMTGSEKLPDNVKFTVADCGYTSVWDEFAHNLKAAHIPEFPLINGTNFFNKTISGYDIRDAAPIESVAKAKIPMLFIHGNKDNFVPTEMVYRLYQASSAPYKDLLIVEGADHAKSYPTDSAAYEAKVKEFAEKFL